MVLAGGAARLLDGLAQRFHVADDRVDLVAEPDRASASVCRDRQLDGAGDGLVDPGVEQAEAVVGVADRAVHALGRCELGLDRGDASARSVSVWALAPRAAASSAWIRPPSIWARPCGQRLAGLRGLPRLVDGRAEPIAQLGDPVAERSGADAADRPCRTDDRASRISSMIGSPGIVQLTEVDPGPSRRPRDGGQHPSRERPDAQGDGAHGVAEGQDPDRCTCAGGQDRRRRGDGAGDLGRQESVTERGHASPHACSPAGRAVNPAAFTSRRRSHDDASELPDRPRSGRR